MPKIMTLATFVVLAATAIASIHTLIPSPVLRPEGLGFKDWAVVISVPSLPHILLCIAAIIACPSKDARWFVLLASFLIGSAGAAVLALDDVHVRDPGPSLAVIICPGLAALVILAVVWRKAIKA